VSLWKVLIFARLFGVIRRSNNPIGDLAEYLYCRAVGWKQAPK
jgi:hypothetical protein